MADECRQPPVGSELEPEEKDRENTIQFYLEAFRDYISSTVNYRDLMYYCHFTRDMRRKFRSKCKSEGEKSAVEDMIDEILNMTDKPQRFTELVTGEFSETENPKVLSILNGEKLPLNSEKSKKHIKQLSKKEVVENLDITHMAYLLVDKKVITVNDQERLLNAVRHESSVEAAIDLINMVGQRDEHWFVKFMICLIELDQKKIAEKVDADLCEKIIQKMNGKRECQSMDQSSMDEIAVELGTEYVSLVPIDSRYSGYVDSDPKFHKEYNLDETGRKSVVVSEETVPKTVDTDSFGTLEADSLYEYKSADPAENNLSPYKPDNSADSISSEAESVKRSLDMDGVPDESLRFDSLLIDSENTRVPDGAITARPSSKINRSFQTDSLASGSSSGDSALNSFDSFLSEIQQSNNSDTSSEASLSDTHLARREASWRNFDDTGSHNHIIHQRTDFSDIQNITTSTNTTSTKPKMNYDANNEPTERKQSMELRQNSKTEQAKEWKDKDVNVQYDGQLNIKGDEDEFTDTYVEIPDVDVSLRKYQEELAGPALNRENVIIVAPTGSGKTRVAMRIIQEHIRQQKGHGIAKVIFLVNQVALANQQGEACRELLKKYSCEVITGESQRKMKCLKDFINKRDILVVTAQVLLDTIVRKEIPAISCFSLIVFDECHHTHANHTFNQIMGRYMDLKFKKGDTQLPQIVGLTASVGVGKSRTIEKAVTHIKQLMANLDAQQICTVNDNITELREHVSLPEEETHKVRGRENDDFGNNVRKLMDAVEKRMAQSSLVRESPEASKLEAILKPPAQKGNAQYTQWVSKLWREIVKIKAPNARRFLNPCRQHLDLYNNALIIYNDARMEDALYYLDQEMKTWKEEAIMDENETSLHRAFTKLRKYSFKVCDNPKLDKLAEMVKKAFSRGRSEDSRGIVFVKTRDLAKAIVNWMNDTPGLRELKPIQFVGQNMSADKGGMTKVEQCDALKYFRDGKHKLIVATSVAEEGLDISKCNLVIRYDHVTNEIAMVQSRGRGRAADSKYYVIAEESTGMAEKEELNMIREVMMRKAIIQLQQYIRNNPGRFKIELSKLQDEGNLDRELKALGKRRKVIRSGQFELRCIKCDHFICWSDDVKKVEDAHHVVIDPTLEERVKLLNSGQSRYQNEAIQFVGKVICRNCGANLGPICIHRTVEFPVLKIENFLIVDTNGRQNCCKQWKSVPFHVSSLSTEDWRELVTNFKEKEGIE